jgi:hypothetical protein
VNFPGVFVIPESVEVWPVVVIESPTGNNPPVITIMNGDFPPFMFITALNDTPAQMHNAGTAQQKWF